MEHVLPFGDVPGTPLSAAIFGPFAAVCTRVERVDQSERDGVDVDVAEVGGVDNAAETSGCGDVDAVFVVKRDDFDVGADVERFDDALDDKR